jgi:hypothetical protein
MLDSLGRLKAASSANSCSPVATCTRCSEHYPRRRFRMLSVVLLSPLKWIVDSIVRFLHHRELVASNL